MLSDDCTDELGRINAPTRIIWGDQDSFSPLEEQQALRAAIPRATMQVYEGAGHAPHWEEPQRVADEIVALTRNLTALAA